nr:electron transport complex subunit RsxC [Pseudomarimonas arenosa]
MRLPAHKEAAARPIALCPLPRELAIPLLQHAGSEGRPRVEPGQAVLAGEVLSCGDDPRFVPIHAPCAGRVSAIEQRPLPHPSRLSGWHVVIKPDHPEHIVSPRRGPPFEGGIEQALPLIRDAGVAGLGGAGFPTHDKLAHSRDWLILNGAECEPYIACDDRLLRERAVQLIDDARLVRRLLQAQRCCIAIEQPMQEAISAVRQALADASDIELRVVDGRYPQGGERQLIQAITGREVPRGRLPRDIGVMVMNVATVLAVGDALSGVPLTRRLVSVAGSGVQQPGVFDVALGTPMAVLIEAAGGYREPVKRLVMGGPMMGLALEHDQYPISKSCNSILLLGEAELLGVSTALPCIRCGDCAEVCPAGLLPQQLFHFSRAGQEARLEQHGLEACIECACCDYVCPSQLPLSAEFRYAKQSLAVRRSEQRAAELARQRFESRQQRLQRQAEERTQKLEAKRRQVAQGNEMQKLLARAKAQAHKQGDET